MRVGIFMADSNGGYPVPASKGGAVPTLVEHLIEENNKTQLVSMDIISIYDADAEKQSKKYPNINFIWIKPYRVFNVLDKLLFAFISKVFKNIKAISYKSFFSLLFCIIQSARIMKKNNYDKVVLENNIPLSWSIRLSGIKNDYYYHLHNVPRINAKCQNVFKKCTGYLCVSKYVANQICSEANPIGPIAMSKINVLYNCIDTTQYCPLRDKNKKTKIKHSYGINENDKVIVFVGRLSEEKGIDKVLEAVKHLNQKHLKVLVVGSLIHNTEVMDEYQRKLHLLADKLSGIVIFTGYITQTEVQKVYQIADVAVLPSMWDEPAGLTMVEAMACGIPVVTTDSGGIPEYMGKHAIVLSRNDKLVSKLAESIERLLNSAELTGQENYNYVIEHFAAATYLPKFLKCLE